MARYRRLSPRFWKDERVITLEQLEKLIALYLFTSPQSNRIGIFSFSPGEACEDLAIPIETFAEGWAKPFENVCRTLNLRWDNVARVLYLPTWWKYNCPENPNVLKACLADLHEVPQTSLIAEFSENLTHLPETFHQTFREGLPKPSPKPSPNLSPQEQYQEQERESAKGKPSPTPRKSKNKETDPRVKTFIDFYHTEYLNRFSDKYVFTAKDGALIKRLLITYDLERLRELAVQFLDSTDPWVKSNGGFTVGVFASQINKIVSTSKASQAKAQPKEMPL